MGFKWDKKEFDLAYGDIPVFKLVNNPDGTVTRYILPIKVGYSRANALPWLKDQTKLWINTVGISASDKVVLVGAGFGWEQEFLEEWFPGIKCVSVDTSEYIHQEKSKSEKDEIKKGTKRIPKKEKYKKLLEDVGDDGPKARVKIVNAEFSTGSGRAAIVQELGEPPTKVITSDILIGLSDQEIKKNTKYLDMLGGQVFHITSITREQGTLPGYEHYNWKRLGEWRTFFDHIGLSHHKIVSANDGKVL
jgi:hypothetical protein